MSSRPSFIRATRGERKSRIMLPTYCDHPKIRDFSQSTETGFPRLKFFSPYFIDGRVFFRVFTFDIVFDDLSLNWLERVCK